MLYKDYLQVILCAELIERYMNLLIENKNRIKKEKVENPNYKIIYYPKNQFTI